MLFQLTTYASKERWMKRRHVVGTAALAMVLGSPLAAPLAQDAAGTPSVGERVLGDPAAPVTIIEYSSLTCPHCAAFHADTLPALKERFVDTGQAKIVYRDFPLDQNALNAAVIAHCAGPDRYFAFLDALFASQSRWARSEDPTESLIQLAGLGGLSRDTAEACLASEAMQDAVLQVRLDGQEEFQISSTPSFIINGEMMTGNQSIDEFATLIEAATP
jgi:protein-disulfide isomerase